MKVDRFTVKSCCGGKSIIFKTDLPISKDLIVWFTKLGFKESPNFSKVGILYVDNLDFIVTGSFGSNKLQVKCRRKDCDQKLNDFEGLLQQFG